MSSLSSIEPKVSKADSPRGLVSFYDPGWMIQQERKRSPSPARRRGAGKTSKATLWYEPQLNVNDTTTPVWKLKSLCNDPTNYLREVPKFNTIVQEECDCDPFPQITPETDTSGLVLQLFPLRIALRLRVVSDGSNILFAPQIH